MAQYLINDEIAALTAAGMTIDDIRAALGREPLVNLGTGAAPRWVVSGRRAEERIYDLVHAKTAATAPAPAAAPSVPLATERQVEYIMSLIAKRRHQEGGFMSGPITREGVRKMTRTAASDYISSLKGSY